jgi:hypothetical protein
MALCPDGTQQTGQGHRCASFSPSRSHDVLGGRLTPPIHPSSFSLSCAPAGCSNNRPSRDLHRGPARPGALVRTPDVNLFHARCAFQNLTGKSYILSYWIISIFWNTTSELRVKLSEMAERIHALETALRDATAPSHPLLSEELLRISNPLEPVRPHGNGAATGTRHTTPLNDQLQQHHQHALQQQQSSPVDTPSPSASSAVVKVEDEARVLDAFGSLSLSNSGGSKFFGHNANAWVRLYYIPVTHVFVLLMTWDTLVDAP